MENHLDPLCPMIYRKVVLLEITWEEGNGQGRRRGRGRGRGKENGQGRKQNRNNNNYSNISTLNKKPAFPKIPIINGNNLKLLDTEYDKNTFNELEFKFNSNSKDTLESSKIKYDEISSEFMTKLIEFLKFVLKDSIIEVCMDKLTEYPALKDFVVNKQMDVYSNINKNSDRENESEESLKNVKLKGKTNYGLLYNNSYTLQSVYSDVLKDLYPTLYETIEPSVDNDILPLNYLIKLLSEK